MQPEQPLINRVEQSGLVSLDLETYFPNGEVVPFDLKEFLFMGLILKEKDFREALKGYDWSACAGKNLAVFCSADAIIPMWAYMLVAASASPFVRDVYLGTPEQFIEQAYVKAIAGLDIAPFEGKRIVVKGCSDRPVPPSAYLEIARRLQPIALSIMFGEPCSTVPVYKKPIVR